MNSAPESPCSPRRFPLLVAAFTACLVALPVLAHEYSEREQAALDAACEAAREEKLAPERERYIEECVEEGQREDRAACERFYADYGNQSGDRAPLYMDLPDCVEAFEYRRDHDGR